MIKGLKRTPELVPDTHAHLDADAFAADIDAVVVRAQEAGVGRILAVGSDLDSSLRAVNLSRQFGSVYAAVGIHPHHAETFQRDGGEVRALLGSCDKVVAVGEVGLDYFRQGSTADVQRRAFQAQVQWACDCGLPLSVHSRDAEDEVLSVLEGLPVPAVMHCFSGSPEQAQRAAAMNLFVSFAGNITFPRADVIRAAARSVPPAQVLVESDAPVLAPQPWRGRRNEPAYITATLATLAAQLQYEPETLGAAITSAANGLFGWREP